MEKHHSSEEKVAESEVFNDYVSRLGHRISGVRTIKKLTQEECALRAGISRASLAKLEAGHGDPKLSTLLSLSQALSIPLTEFVCALQPELWEIAAENGTSQAEAAGLSRATSVGAAPGARMLVPTAGTIGGSLAAGAAGLSGGAATASGLAAIGGGMATGILTAAAPVTAVGAIAYGLFKLFDE